MKTKTTIIIIMFITLLSGNLFPQNSRPENIISKITNLHHNQETNTIEFTLKFKADAPSGYQTNNPQHGCWLGSNIYWHIYPNAGVTLNLANTTIKIGDNNDIGSNDISIIPNDHPGELYPPAGAIPFAATITRNSNGNNDLQQTYKTITTYSIPILTGTPDNNFHIIQKSKADGWGISGSIWATDRSQPGIAGNVLTEKPAYYLQSNCPQQAIWTGVIDNDWFDADNWANPAETHLPVLEASPGNCTKVFIPGRNYRGNQLSEDNPIKNFPILNEAQLPECDEITFFQGGQIGRIDLLKYNKARIQLNFLADESTTGVPYNDPAQFYNFAKGYSTDELAAGRWHMLSMPIKGVVSGDFGYGGFPMTFMRKFDVLADGTGRFTEGDWSTSYTETTEPLNPGEGFIFYMYKSGTNFGEIYNADNGNTIDPLTGATYSISGQPNYGLLSTASVMELPTYDNPEKLNSHRIQKYENGISSFYNIAVNEGYLGAIMDSYSEKTRSDEDFKLITEDFPYFAYAADREVLLGNPYMSALDFGQFYQSHRMGPTPRISNYYKIWDGAQFLTFDCESQTVIGGGGTIPFTQYIAPMQSFIVKGSNPNNFQFNFTAETLSTVTPANTSTQLRSNTNPDNFIRIST